MLNKLQFIQLALSNNNNKKKTFYMKNIGTVRNSLTINPLEQYSITSPTVVPVNTLVKQGNYGFIGGDTEYLSYDFGLKVAGSVVECPMKIYVGANPAFINNTASYPPTKTGDGWNGWLEKNVQANIDNIKAQDGTLLTDSYNISAQQTSYMIELDLTPVANSLFGGSNSALKSALKTTSNFDIYAIGSGSNVGVSTSGVIFYVYNGSSWVQVGTNTTGTISKINNLINNSAYIQANNKINILVASQYASDGTIASSVSLDYVNIGIQLNRTPDVIQPINVNVPKYWGMVGGFSPNFSNNNALTKTLFRLYKDSNNYIDLIYSSGILTLRKNVSGSLVQLSSNAQTFSKNQGYRFIVGQTANGMVLRILKSTGTMETYSNTNTQNMQNSYSFYMEQNEANSSQGDCFMEKFTLLDLNKLGRTNGFTDAEADAILRGTIPNLIGSYNTELFDISKVNLHPNASLSGGVITLNATGVSQYSTIDIPVLANNKYEFKINKTGLNGYVSIGGYYNNILTQSITGGLGSGQIDGQYTLTFTTNNNVNKIRILLTNTTAGTFTYTNCSLKIKM